MIFLPHASLFLSALLLSTISLMASSHWLMVWTMLEVNMISFIPLMGSSKLFREAEASMKYFLFQALGATLILVAFIFPTYTYFLWGGLMLKLGAAPLHIWFPCIMSNISWASCIILTTWQKLGPLVVLIFTQSTNTKSLLLLISALSALVGSLGGLSQSQTRLLIAYSSISHLGWMLAAMMKGMLVLMMYFLIYSIIGISLMSMMWYENVPSLKTNGMPLITAMTLSILLLSMGGLPPLTGFFAKWSVLINMNMYLMAPLLLSSIISVFFYLNVSLTMMMSIMKKKESGGSFLMMIMSAMISSMGLPLLFSCTCVSIFTDYSTLLPLLR